MEKTSSLDVSVRTLVSYPPRIFRWVVDAVLVATIVALVFLFVLQFMHSPKLLQLSWIARLKGVGDPLIEEIRSWTGLNWPADTGFTFIPLAIAFFIWWIKIAIDGLFLKATIILSKPSPVTLTPAAAGSSTRSNVASGTLGCGGHVRHS